MHLVKEVLRLTAAGLSQRQIGRSLHLSHGVVGKYQAAAQRASLSWPLPEELDDATLAARLGTKTDDRSITQSSGRRASPDFAAVHEQLKLKGVTRLLQDRVEHLQVAALQLPVVTEKDVRRIMHQIGPLPEEPVQTAECSSTDAPSPKPKNGANSIWLPVFGVVLPAFTIGFELFTRLCAGVFFDPLPTFFHVVLAAFVPLANWLTLRTLRNHRRPVSRELWFANGIACGVSLLYAAPFLPMSPFAIVGIIFAGAGLLPLAPLLAFVSALQLRVLLKRQQLLRDETVFRGWGWSMTAPILVLMLFSLPGPLTRHWINQAGSESPEISNRAVQLLRTWGSETTILKEAYGRGNRLWVERLGKHYSASLLTAGGLVYFTSDRGTTTVVRPGPIYEAVAVNELKEDCYSSAAVSGGRPLKQGLRRSIPGGLEEGREFLDGLCESWGHRSPERRGFKSGLTVRVSLS
jgi:hypothetical protein